MKTVSIASMLPYEPGASYLHSQHGQCTVLACDEGKFMCRLLLRVDVPPSGETITLAEFNARRAAARAKLA